MADYASWVTAGGWDRDVPPNIPKKIWESLGKQKYKIERQYKNRGRNWSSFIREIPADVVERLQHTNTHVVFSELSMKKW